MQRARRLASVAVVASLAVAGLSACRSEPSVAAYVGDRKITESDVEAVIDQASDAAAAARQAQAQAQAQPKLPGRSEVVTAMLSVDVLAKVAAKRGVSLPADLALAQYASALSLPETADYVRLFATAKGYVQALREKATSGPEPTDAELREVYDVLAKQGLVEPGQSVAQFKAALTPPQKQQLQTATGVRHEIAEITGPMKIRVNPRYQPAAISVLDAQTQTGGLFPLVAVPLGPDETTPVTDLS